MKAYAHCGRVCLTLTKTKLHSSDSILVKGWIRLTPEEARQLGEKLIATGNEAEAIEKKFFPK